MWLVTAVAEERVYAVEEPGGALPEDADALDLKLLAAIVGKYDDDDDDGDEDDEATSQGWVKDPP